MFLTALFFSLFFSSPLIIIFFTLWNRRPEPSVQMSDEVIEADEAKTLDP